MSNLRLGKGLDALIKKTIPESEDRETGITTVKIENISPNHYQPRIEFDQEKLEDLANSIKENGIIQPLVVTKQDNTSYELIAGQRRLEAAKIAGYEKVPVIIRSVSEQEQLQFAIIENVQRENLNPIEEAKGYNDLQTDFNLTHAEIAKVTGKSRTTVTNALRILQLPKPVQNMVLKKKLSAGHARAVLQVKEELQSDFADYLINHKLSVRKAEQAAKTFGKKPAEKQKQPTSTFKKTENNLSSFYNVKVKIKDKNNKGRVILHYKNAEEREKLLQLLRKNE